MTVDVKWSWLEANKDRSKKVRYRRKHYLPKINGLRAAIRGIQKYKIDLDDNALTAMFTKLVFYELQEKKLKLFADFLDKTPGKPLEEWYYKKLFFDEVEAQMKKELDFTLKYYKQYGWV